MNGPFVVDASVVLSWCFEDEVTPFGHYVLARLDSTRAVAPALLPFEVASGVLIGERRGRITVQGQQSFWEMLRQLPIEIEHRPITWLSQQILPLARRHRISAYDASYLELAIRDGLPLATLDGELRNAALSAGVALIEMQP